MSGVVPDRSGDWLCKTSTNTLKDRQEPLELGAAGEVPAKKGQEAIKKIGDKIMVSLKCGLGENIQLICLHWCIIMYYYCRANTTPKRMRIEIFSKSRLKVFHKSIAYFVSLMLLGGLLLAFVAAAR